MLGLNLSERLSPRWVRYLWQGYRCRYVNSIPRSPDKGNWIKLVLKLLYRCTRSYPGRRKPSSNNHYFAKKGENKAGVSIIPFNALLVNCLKCLCRYLTSFYFISNLCLNKIVDVKRGIRVRRKQKFAASIF